jgi:hypothetical protein
MTHIRQGVAVLGPFRSILLDGRNRSDGSSAGKRQVTNLVGT